MLKNLPIGVEALIMKITKVDGNQYNNVLKGSASVNLIAEIKPIKIGMAMKTDIDALNKSS